jgi:hypothetical protein
VSVLTGQPIGPRQPTILVRDPMSGMPYTVPVFYTADGKPVVNRLNSHMSPQAAYWMPRAVAMVDTKDVPFIRAEVEFPHVIGETIVVPTGDDDDIVYVVRDRQAGYSRAVRGRQPIPTNKMTVLLKRKDEDERREQERQLMGTGTVEPVGYVLITAQIGVRGPEPIDVIKSQARTRREEPQLWQAAREFWQRHAFCLEWTFHWQSTLTKEPPPEWRALLEEAR